MGERREQEKTVKYRAKIRFKTDKLPHKQQIKYSGDKPKHCY